MHSRKELEKPAIVSAAGKNTFEYEIVKCIGKGANSIVYEAHYSDSNTGSHSVRLKECYPYTSNVKRIGDALVWENETQKENDFAKFKNAYHKLLNMQNSSNISNSTAHTFDLIEANGTLYSIMDANEGKTFDEDKTDNLVDVLKTVRALAKVVGEYHNNGYLHLDIKPSNFLTIKETRELVILFDVDSVTSIDEIKAGLVKCVPFSNDWAAPEQMQGKISKLCPATDIFSIGAVLFEKVMGRKFNNDDLTPFANWEFKGEKFDKVNPKIKRLLSEIFHKTLSANIKRRFKSCDELIVALDEAISVSSVKTFIVPSYIQSKNFIGRKEDLKEINALLKTNSNVFIHGFAGTGKTELAREYSIQNKEDFDTIVFCRYNGSLISSLQGIPVANFEDYKENFKFEFEKLCNDDRLLIILDNFDVDADSKQDDLEYFLNLNCKKIITTRTNFSSRNDAEIYHLECLVFDDALELFKFHSKIHEFSNEDISEIKAIFAKVACNTLFICRLAKEISSRGLTVSKLAINVMTDLLKKVGEAEVYKDGKISNTTIYDLAKALFKIDELLPDKLQVMRNLYMLRWRTVNLAQYREIACFNMDESIKEQAVDSLKYLESRGFIENSQPNHPDREIYFHPLVLELISKDYRPTIELCPKIAEYYQNKLNKHLSNFDKAVHPMDKNVFIKDICVFYKSLDVSNRENIEYIINSIYISSVKPFYSNKTLSEFFLVFSKNENFLQTLELCNNTTKFKLINTRIWSALNGARSSCSSVFIFNYEMMAINAIAAIHKHCLKNPDKGSISCFVEGISLFSKHFENFYQSGNFKKLDEFSLLRDHVDYSEWERREKEFFKLEEYIRALENFMNSDQKKICSKYVSYLKKGAFLPNPPKFGSQDVTLDDISKSAKLMVEESKDRLHDVMISDKYPLHYKIQKVKQYYASCKDYEFWHSLSSENVPQDKSRHDIYIFLKYFLSVYGRVFDESVECFNYIRWMYACLSLNYNIEEFHKNMKILMKQLEKITILRLLSGDIRNIWNPFYDDEVLEQDRYDFFTLESIDAQLISKYIIPYIRDYLSFCESVLEKMKMDKQDWYRSVVVSLKNYSARYGSDFLTLFKKYEIKYHNSIGKDWKNK